jgi:gas vesicle protein
VGIAGAALVMGVALGAGAALLLAPQSGEETREMLGDSARRLGDRVADRLDDIRGDLHRTTRRSRRKLRRGMTRGRWVLEDVLPG